MSLQQGWQGASVGPGHLGELVQRFGAVLEYESKYIALWSNKQPSKAEESTETLGVASEVIFSILSGPLCMQS